MSSRYAPFARAMNGGSPPTPPNARAGLFTPPGITRLAHAKASWLLGRRKLGLDRGGVVGFIARDVAISDRRLSLGGGSGDPDSAISSSQWMSSVWGSPVIPGAATSRRQGHGR